MSAIRSIRLSASVTVALIAGFWLLRVAASNCEGSGCEWFIPVSLLLPLMVLAMVVITAARSIPAARGRRGWNWVVPLALVASTAGPILSLVIWRDHPDTFVSVASALVLVLPAAALAFSLFAARPEHDQVLR